MMLGASVAQTPNVVWFVSVARGSSSLCRRNPDSWRGLVEESSQLGLALPQRVAEFGGNVRPLSEDVG